MRPDVGSVGGVPIDDEELARQALAADVDAPIPADAVPWCARPEAAGATGMGDWYMAPLGAGAGVSPGWRRRVAVAVITAIGLINAAGLCITYGHVTLG
jgi:hypothetical protein